MGRARRTRLRLLPRAWCVIALLAATAHAQVPEPAEFAQNVIDGSLDPTNYTFDREFWDRSYQERLAWGIEVSEIIGKARSNEREGKQGGCDPRLLVLDIVLESTASAAGARSADEWYAQRAAALARMREIEHAVETADDHLKAGGSPRVAELMRRHVRERALLAPSAEAGLPALLAPGDVSDELSFRYDLFRDQLQCENAAWLEAQMAQIGWFDIPNFGAAADDAAWQMVQHADLNVAFQRKALQYLSSLPASHTFQSNLAFLWDRVAVNSALPQRFGTQGECHYQGFVPFEVEDYDNLEVRRSEAGIVEIDPVRDVARAGCPSGKLAERRRIEAQRRR